ncbi:MAG: orotidine 5'-phosphate decarboxylase / HUMPS family protein [bacterium]|nr:orotidine 5'-phosphate decarboxylase / HUMPS family protein [bacterium]
MNVAERLIVAADFDPRTCGGATGVKVKVMALARALEGTGVIIKVNSVLRALGYDLIRHLHDFGLKVFADLKIVDIAKTLEYDGAFLAECKPAIVTVMGAADVDGIHALKKAIGADTEVLAVTVLTSHDDNESFALYGCPASAGVLRFARLAKLGGADGLILSPQELSIVTKKPELAGMTFNTPGIRPSWSIVPGDDQKRVANVGDALLAGADRIVVGRPILNAKPNDQDLPANPREAVLRTLASIENAVAVREA